MTLIARLVVWLAVMVAQVGAAAAQDEITYDQMRELAATDYVTLTAPLPIAQPDAPFCDMARAGQTYALLVGADSFGPQSEIRLAGSQNSVALLAETLAGLGVDPLNVITLSDKNATRAGLTRAAEAILGRVSCTDMVVVYLTAVMGTTMAFADAMTGGQSTDDWITAAADSDPVMRSIVEAAPFLLLNETGQMPREIISAAALSDLVTRLRNGSAHVTVMLDTTYAATFDLTARQMAVDGRLMWREALSPLPLTAGAAQVPLSARAGALSVIYAADKTSMSAEMALPEGSPDAAIYGLFAFKMAAALRADPALTLPSLARHMAALQLAPEYGKFQNHLMESSDASLPILAERVTDGIDAQPLPDLPAPNDPASGDVIRITAPEPARGAAPLDTAQLTLKGQVDWPEDTMIVLVNKQQALSRADGRFEQDIDLVQGLNRVEIVALTRDNRQHSRTVEFTYAGDAAALAGQGRRYALLIGNQTYGGTTGMSALQTPFADINALADVLTRRYGFVTEATLPDGGSLPLILQDATRAQIETTLFQLSLIAGEADQVLVYYGGHGVFEQITGTAFWVPADAVAGVPPSYISASGISEALLRFQARSVIVVSDSCYAGAMMRGADARYDVTGDDRLRMLQRLAAQRSRVLITSGANEPVADAGGDGHSIFARALLTALDQADGPVTAREVFDQWVLPIVVGRAEQEPQYRPIAKSGHEGGDFVFAPVVP